MNKLYTAVGRMQFKGRNQQTRCPMILLDNKEYILDMQEMMVWIVLNWRILSEDEIQTLYQEKEREIGYMTHRPVTECVRRLIQRGLIAEGYGKTSVDALYDLLSSLYIIPISENLILRAISFIRLTVFEKIPYSVTKRIFSRDKRSEDEKKVMVLANRTTLSTAEVIKCVELKAFEFRTEEELVDILYHDEYTTSENIAHSVRFLPQCRPVLTSVANLYLRRQIVFERR